MKQALDCMYFSVLTLGGAAVLNKAVARQIKANQRRKNNSNPLPTECNAIPL